MGEEITDAKIYPIYERIYDSLIKRELDKIQYHELLDLICRMRIRNGDKINCKIRKFLLEEIGFTRVQADKVLNKISYYTRYQKPDARLIIKEMINLGWLERCHYHIFIKKKPS